MRRNVTAIYRSHATADLVRSELDAAGVSARHIHVIPDRDVSLDMGNRDDDNRRYMDDLHDLHLPENDLRTYQNSVRQGDYVVSANVDDDQVARVQQIMRRPEAEAYDLDARDTEFLERELTAHSDPSRRDLDSEWLGQRDSTNTDPYVRSYRRNIPLGDRNPR